MRFIQSLLYQDDVGKEKIDVPTKKNNNNNVHNNII